jgi:hypothetical protein
VDVLTIYAIDLMYEEPEFEEKGKFKFPSQDLTNVFFLNGTPEGDGRFNSAHLNQEYAFIYCQPFFVAWDWVKDTAARWSLDDPLQKVRLIATIGSHLRWSFLDRSLSAIKPS